ncbi:hypothetical protein [Serratia sp. FS14]|uniref:hypothetical protein n=1 Tax=Serratia sp. (strain FS14) TaxID=1327989 RepID=UPI001184D6DF|nr:hypothetical protein [Serratia sp. FS14]
MSEKFIDVPWHDQTFTSSTIRSTRNLDGKSVKVDSLHLPLGRYSKIEVHIQNDAGCRTSVETCLRINKTKAVDDKHHIYTHHEDLWDNDSRIYTYTVNEEDSKEPTDIYLQGHISSANLLKGGGARITLRGYFHTP